MLRQYRLRMKLYPADIVILVPERHDAVVLFVNRCHCQYIRQALRIYHPGMIATYLEALRQTGKQLFISVSHFDRRSNTMHRPAQVIQLTAENLGNGLLTQTYAKD